MIIPNSRGRLDDLLLPDWTLTQQLYDITCWAHGCESCNLLSSWMEPRFLHAFQKMTKGISSSQCPLLLVMFHNTVWWRFMGWNPNDYKAMSSTAESRKWHGSGWLMISWRHSCFYFSLICLYACYGHFLHLISIGPVCCWLGAFLVVLLVLQRCFEGCTNKELMNKRGVAWRPGGEGA